MFITKKLYNQVISDLTEKFETANRNILSEIDDKLEVVRLCRYIKDVLLSIYMILKPFQNSYFVITYIREDSTFQRHFITKLRDDNTFLAIELDLYHVFSVTNIRVRKVGVNDNNDIVALISYSDIHKSYCCYVIFNETMDMINGNPRSKPTLFYYDNPEKDDFLD